MAHETLPNADVGAAFAQYEKDRSRIVGGDLVKSGLKAAGVGLYAAATIFASRIVFGLKIAGATVASINGGVLLAGGALAYGGLKLIEGIGKSLRGMKVKLGGGGGGHH